MPEVSSVSEPKKLKATLRIPTKQMYAYIELQVEGTAAEIVDAYLRTTAVYQATQQRWDAEKPPF